MAPPASVNYANDPKATYLVLTCVATLSFCLIISIWHGDFSAIVALLGLVAIQIGSQDLLFLFGVLGPCSLIVDIFWLVERTSGPGSGHHSGHGWLIFFTVMDMLAKSTGALLAWSLYTSTSADVQYTLAPTTNPPAAPHSSGGFNAPVSYQPPPSFAPPSFAPQRGDNGQESTTYQPFPTSQAPVHVL